MNLYVLVEGQRTEKEIYRTWIPLVNPRLSKVDNIASLNVNNFFIFAAFGYPAYLETISNAILDCNEPTNRVDRLVIAVDSENMTAHDKFQEISDHVSRYRPAIDVRIIIQHFCIETWALGNRTIHQRPITEPFVREFKQLYDVYELNPELLPDNLQHGWNRSQFAERYLIHLLLQKNPKLTYSKSSPESVAHQNYFKRLKQRLADTGHIGSFQTFLDAFV